MLRLVSIRQWKCRSSSSRKEIPVDEPQVVARDVIPEVGKLDALPLALAAPLPLHPAAEDFPRHQLEPLELGQ
jgi:hypothetical protein